MSTETPPPLPSAVPLGDEILTTRDVAARLAVSDATVKRWADDALLPCYKTPGGHRKFRLSDVQAFIQSHRFQVPPPPVRLESTELLADEVQRLALSGDGAALSRLVFAARDAGLPLAALLDEALAPALVEVGEKWACGQIGVGQEHVASQAVSDVLAQLSGRSQAQPTRGEAVIGCVAGERHDIASRMVSLLLREAGYRVLHTGADTPLDELLRLAQGSNARLVALSLSRAAQAVAAGLSTLQPLADWAQQAGAHVVVGGGGFEDLGSLPPSFHVVPNMRALAQFLEQGAP